MAWSTRDADKWSDELRAVVNIITGGHTRKEVKHEKGRT